MAVIQIRKAKREGARLVIALAAWTGKGKTYTAIQLAYGLANYDASKVGFLDAENRRGSLCADILQKSTVPTDEPFLIADLYPPFTPERYIEAIQEFQKAGIEVLVIDSSSHEWEGTGGCIEIADALNGSWNKPKARHKKFVNAMLQCDMHIIVCVRAREKDKPEMVMKDGREKVVYVDLGLQPIQEKNFMFEMTASLLLFDEGKRQEVLKCPADLQSILGRKEGYITSDDGKAIRDWVDGAKQLNPVVEKFRNRLILNCEIGVEHIEKCWSQTPADIQAALGEEFHQTLVASAQGYDKARAEAQGADGPPQADPAAASIAAAAKAGIERAQQQAAAATQAATPQPAATPPAATEQPQAAAAQPASTPAATARPPASNTPPAAARPARTNAIAKPAPTAAKVPQSDPLF